MTMYIVLCAQVVGSGPFQVIYNYDGRRFTDRARAISHGFEIRGSDDFNVGVLKDGRLVSVDWMEQVVDSKPEVLRKIADQIGAFTS
jgi:hypothetical protein